MCQAQAFKVSQKTLVKCRSFVFCVFSPHFSVLPEACWSSSKADQRSFFKTYSCFEMLFFCVCTLLKFLTATVILPCLHAMQLTRQGTLDPLFSFLLMQKAQGEDLMMQSALQPSQKAKKSTKITTKTKISQQAKFWHKWIRNVLNTLLVAHYLLSLSGEMERQADTAN